MSRPEFLSASDRYQACAQLFQGLCHERRLHVLQTLLEADERLHVSAIANRTDLSLSLVSHHLQ